MAYYSIFPEKDATIYSHPDRSTVNTGKDEVLELTKEKGSTDSLYYPSRILLKFSNNDLQTAINFSNNFVSNLQLFSTEHQNLASEQSIEVFALSQSWDEGTGRYHNLPSSSNGCSWIYRDNSTSQTKWLTASFGVGSTGSISNNTSLTKGGGEWYTGSNFRGAQSFTNANSLDLDIDVTSIVQKFSASLFDAKTFPSGVINHGFIIKNSDDVEEDVSGSKGSLQFFSVDTHTIYPPKLIFKWDDSTHPFVSNSSVKASGELNVSLYNNKSEYNQNEEALIRLHVRDKYPNRTFTTTSNFLNTGYLTAKSYYSVRDAHTEEIIIPFDTNYTKLSADGKGMYFKLYMKGLQPERYYRLLFKHINDDGTQVYDNNYHFKVVR